MKNFYILILLNFISCGNKAETDKITTQKIYCEFGAEIKKEIAETISLIDKFDTRHENRFGLNFTVCDVDNGNFELTVLVTNDNPTEYFYENTNKFMVVSNKLIVPLISNDIYFSEVPNQNRGQKTKGGCLKKIFFTYGTNNEYVITKVEKCLQGI